LVTALAVAEPPKAALGPEPGAVKVTVTPLTGLLLASVTVACSRDAKVVFTVAVCEEPPLAVMLAAVNGGLTVTIALVSAAPSKVTLPAPDVTTQVTISI
jgi:hypothetical protein